MPLPEKARVEIYIPDLPAPAYQELLERLEREFTFGFGGCTIQLGLSGSYLPYSVSGHLPTLSTYADALRNAAFLALDEEAILVTVTQVYHP